MREEKLDGMINYLYSNQSRLIILAKMENSQLPKSSNESQKVLIVHNSQCQLHTSSRKHPELPFRITAILEALSKHSIFQASQLPNALKIDDLTAEQIQNMISSVHGERYFEFVQYMWDQNCKKSEMYINIDTYYMKHTFAAAVSAVKTALLSVRALATQRYAHAFAVVRPPGHHSGLKTQPHGFSFFNNVAISAQYALKNKCYQRVAIVDWDAHHGQGTQNIFYKRKDVLYVSLHRFDNGKFFPHVPQSGSQFCGEGEGAGFNINICWNLPEKKPNEPYDRDESVGDEEYSSAFKRIVMPILRQYDPEVIMVSCGFDSGEGDHIGNLKISENGYGMMTRQLKSLGKPILAVLEGGYNEAVLGWGSRAVVDALLDSKNLKHIDETAEKANKIGEQGINKCIEEVGKFWSI